MAVDPDKESNSYYLNAAISVMENAEIFTKGHKFRALCISAVSYVAKSYDLEFPKDSRNLTNDVLDLGVVINDHYDIAVLNSDKYKRLRQHIHGNPFVEEQFHKYYAAIRKLERNRPSPGMKKECIKYREQTNLVSIALTCSTAFHIPVENLVNLDKFETSASAPKWLNPLFHLVMALQVADDMVGSRGDVKSNRPSFFTAFGSATEAQMSNENFMESRFRQMGPIFENYISTAVAEDKRFSEPIAGISKALYKFLPGMAELINRTPLLRRMGSKIGTGRDFKQI